MLDMRGHWPSLERLLERKSGLEEGDITPTLLFQIQHVVAKKSNNSINAKGWTSYGSGGGRNIL
jgi:hypothetical protein